ncbi:MAG: glycosyltransferase [Trebonia sp.]
MPTTAPQSRHAVTALIVAHDGARLLPTLVPALSAQTYAVEQAVGVDTGSRDRSGAVLAELIGQDAVFGMDRSTGYGEAVAVALRHASRHRSGTTDPGLTRIEWIWLLHDDCEPAPDALEKLLRAASRDRSVVVLGPKVLDGQDRRTLREVGVSIDRAGRRVTGIDPGEIDQGQHDHKRAVLAVGSAGMLVRRDVWDRLGGFDPGLKLFRDDVDFCWRVQAAGLRVQVVTDAILYHGELAARRRRPTEGGNARRLDRRNALFVLAVNLPLLTMLRVVGGCIVGSLIRAAYFLLTKQLDLSAAFAFSVAGLLAHPIRLLRARRRRAAGMAEGYYAVRVFIPPARTLSRLAEKVAGLVSNGPPQASYGRHQATAEESEEDEQFVDQQSVVRRVIAHPGVQLFVALLLIALIAERRLLSTSPLGGGALVPAWGGAGALWQEYLAGFHAVSVGSTASAPSYVAVVAGLATVFGGQAWLAVDVLLLGCVPLAGLTAYLATRWLVTATSVRVLLAASYALLPVATGAVAAGRLGTAVAFILLPLVAVSAGRMLTAAPRQARRSAWATGLLIAVAAAFAPLTGVFGVVLVIGALAARRWLIAVDPVNAVIVVATPFFVLFPWSLHLLTSPAGFLSEAGVSTPGLTTRGLSATALLGLSPGGPGVPPVWVTIGFGLALLGLLSPWGPIARAARVRPDGELRADHRTGLVIAGWAVAIAGLLVAVVVSRVTVTPPAGGQSANGWPGVALAVAALGLLVASAPAAQWLASIIPNGGGLLPSAPPGPTAGYGRSRRLLACAALAAAATAPLLVAVYWVSDGVRGPVGSIAAPLLPAYVSASSTSGEQYRTLILRPGGGGLDYLVVRQGDPTLGVPELGVAAAAGAGLSRQVAALGTPDGADAGDPGLVLGSYGIKWVLLPSPVDPVLAQRLDAALGLVALNKGASYDLWQVSGPVARVRVVADNGKTTALTSEAVNLSGVNAPAAGGTLVLAEPYGGWTATLNGQALKPVATPVNGWAQGFVLPPGGGHLSITRNNLARTLSLIVELLATLAICLLALPGKRADPAAEARALTALREARNAKRGAGSTPRPGALSLRAAGAGHRAIGGVVRPGFVGKRRAGRARPDLETVNDASAGQSSPRRMLAIGAAADAGSAPAKTETETTAAFAARAGLADGDLADRGQDSYGGLSADAGTGGMDAAPWDMASDWDSLSQQKTSVPESPVLGTPVPEIRAPWETGPQRAPWESGPQPTVSSTGTQPRYPWGTGRRAPVAPTGAQPAAPTAAQPAARTGGQSVSQTGPRPVSQTGPRPASPTGAQPAARTGGQPTSQTGPRPIPQTGTQSVSQTGPRPVSSTGAEPVSPTGTQPVGMAPWESGDWGGAAGWAAVPGDQGSGPAEPGTEPGPGSEPETGSGAWPVAAQPAQPAKPERHSHRAAKHGRPSRWRGSGKRSSGEGES